MKFVCKITLIALAAWTAGGCGHPSSNERLRLDRALDSLRDDAVSDVRKIKIATEAEDAAASFGDTRLELQLCQQTGELLHLADSLISAEACFRRAAQLAIKSGDRAALGIALNNIGCICDETSRPDSALKCYREAGVIFQSLQQAQHYAQTLVNRAIICKNEGDFRQSLRLNLSAIRTLGQLRDSASLSDAYSTLGNTMKSARQYSAAVYYHNKALSLRAAMKDSIGIAGSLNNIGNVYRYEKEYALAIASYRKSCEIKKRAGSTHSLAVTIDNLGETYFELGQYAEAKRNFEKAMDLHRESGDTSGYLTSANRLARILMEHGDLQAARNISERASRTNVINKFLQQRLDNVLVYSEILGKTGQWKEALRYARLALDLKDSLLNTTTVQVLSDMQMKYESQVKEAKISGQRSEIRNQRHQNQWLTVGVACASLVVAGTGIAYRRSSRQKKIIEKQKKEIIHNNRNNLQQMIGMLGRQDDAAPGQNASENQERLVTLAMLNRFLYENDAPGEPDPEIYFRQLCRFKEIAYEMPIHFSCEHALPHLNPILIKDTGLILNELTTNAVKHGFRLRTPEDRIEICIRSRSQYLEIICTDNGTGLPAGFDIGTEANLSFGLKFVRDLTDQHTGTVQAGGDRGACLTVKLKI